MSFTDFPNGIQSVDDYLSQSNPTNATLTGSTADISRLVVSAEFDDNLKEIICSLLAGRGLKLPNIQICVSLNLKELLGVEGLESELSDALNDLDSQLDEYLEHTKLDQVLSRANNVIAEVTNIANMINFCSSPVDPVAIPNVLEDAMESFLGKGKELIDRIGTLVPDEIGGCLIDGEFNCTAFSGGLLGSICDNLSELTGDNPDTALVESLTNEAISITQEIQELIDRENTVSGTYELGGSDLSEDPRPVNDQLGVLYNAQDEGIQGATSNAGILQASYQNLGSYQVVDTSGNVYNNIFELFLDDDLLRILRRTPDPRPEISDRIPVRNYCGEIIGYTDVVSQDAQDTSVGKTPGQINQPGFNAGGISTNPASIARAQAEASESGQVVNQITNITNVEGGAVLFYDSETALLDANTEKGQIVYRTDQDVTYVNNGGTSGTMSDFDQIGGENLSAFLSEVNNETGSGLLSRSGSSSEYRTITGTNNQISVTNGGGLTANPKISISDNAILPGTDSIKLPSGATGDRVSTTNGAVRYNTSLGRFEGYQSGSWQTFATGASAVNDSLNVGGGSYEVFKQNNSGVLEFRTLESAGGISISVASDVITFDDQITASNLGSGSRVFKQRTGNDFELRSITAGNNVTVTENTNDVEVSADLGRFEGTVSTTDGSLTEVLFDGSRQTPPTDTAWFFSITAVANRTGTNDVTAIKLEGIADNNSGTVVIVGTSGNKTIYNSTPGTSNYDLTVDVISNQVRVRVNGDSGHNVDWRVRYEPIAAP